MKNIRHLLLLLLTAAAFNTASAHYLWIEAQDKWAVGKPGTIRIYYGEYAEGAREEAGKRLEEANGLTAWVLTPGGEKIPLSLQKMNNHFLASYTPATAGKFEIELVNTSREVVDWTQYDIGIVQPTYYAHKPFYAGGSAVSKATPSLSFQILPAEEKAPFSVNKSINLKLLYGGKDLKGKLMVYAPNTWMKELESQEGIYSFIPPEKGMYIIESIYKEKIPGTFRGKAYEAIRHRTTFTLTVQ
ncbi:DUF4198 domain-containing protein [Sediminibacterium soli]|uniref:DUF4198 domain-containing protein n=1 Tax=Sediminibacterium soli TaxID=2698829 RepID=UPI001379CDFA|nr:DUF4198 domain-containing protein [Sediminibacterium soli]NCI48269.1 DUF4198 domain-containing protein [Sediminibacterium soli]